MPRTGGGTGPFVLNPVYLAVPGTTILATQHNTPLEDIEDTFNIPQPIAYGGTQAASAIDAMDNLFIVGADKASSASIDLDNVTGSFVNITGTTPITSIALTEGSIRFARAVSALPLTASASLIINGSTTQSYTCEAGDQMMIIGYAAAVVRIWVTGRNKFLGSQFNIADETDQTKVVKFSAAGIPTATARQLDVPYYSGTLGLVSDIRGQIYGLTLSNNVTDATNDIDIAAGSAVDSTGVVSMLLASAYTKRLDAAWAVGSGNGGRMSAAAIADTTYHVFLIRRPDTGVVDVGFDTSPTAPTLPANYTQFRRIGSIMRESGAIAGFNQYGDRFLRKVWATYASGTNPGTSVFSVTIGIPVGMNLDAILQVGSTGNGSNSDARGVVFLPGSVSTPGAGLYNFGGSNMTTVGNPQYWGEITVTSSVLATVNVKLSASGAASQVNINTVGWIDTRGRDA